MELLSTIKNNTVEIIIICAVVIGATSSVFMTLYGIQMGNITTKYEADIASMRNSCEDRIKELTSSDCTSEVSGLRNDYENRIRLLQSELSEKRNTDCSAELNVIKSRYEARIKDLEAKLKLKLSEKYPESSSDYETLSKFLNINLLKNHSAEFGIDEWNVPDNYKTRSSEPSASDGTFYFFPGDNIAEATAYQDIDLSEIAEFIKKYELKAEIRGYMRDYNNQDISQLIIEFMSKDKIPILVVKSPMIAQNGKWAEFKARETIPSETVSVRFNLKSTRRDGNNNDGYFDNLYFGILSTGETPETKYKR